MTIKYLGNSQYNADDRCAVIAWKSKEDIKGEKVLRRLEELGYALADLFGYDEYVKNGGYWETTTVTNAYISVEDVEEFEHLKKDYLAAKRSL